MTDWTDAELNPIGLRYADDESRESKNVNVTVTARALAHFKSADGHKYLCAFVDDSKPRAVFVLSENQYVEVTDKKIQFIVSKWTSEIIESRRR
jgi:hypothetical protein